MKNSDIEYEKYVNKSFFKKLDDDEKNKYSEYIKNLHSLYADLVKVVVKEPDGIFSDDSIENFVVKLVEIKKYVDINEWKNYIIDSILEQESIGYSEVKVTEHINYLFDKQ